MRQRAIAVASEGHVAEAATAMLARGNAVDAVISAIFVAAAASATVLLGPVQILVGGAGAGLRAIDGRCHQPGHGVQRPRGFKADDVIPPAARVAVPALPAALATALANFGRTTLAQVLAPAIERARPIAERAQVLKRIAQYGPSALTEEGIAAELIAAAGRVPGGLLTNEDLQRVRPSAEACEVGVVGDRRIATVPWGAGAVRGDSEAAPMPATFTQLVAVADGHGLIAIACYESPYDGLAIPELGLSAPFCAAPVLRGQARVRPGDLRPAAAPMALGEREGIMDVALGIAAANGAETRLQAVIRALGTGMPLDLALGVQDGAPGGLTVGVVRDRDGAQALVARAS